MPSSSVIGSAEILINNEEFEICLNGSGKFIVFFDGIIVEKGKLIKKIPQLIYLIDVLG